MSAIPSTSIAPLLSTVTRALGPRAPGVSVSGSFRLTAETVSSAGPIAL
jgi:hypothetical protein